MKNDNITIFMFLLKSISSFVVEMQLKCFYSFYCFEQPNDLKIRNIIGNSLKMKSELC